jgi:hypothetical protein
MNELMVLLQEGGGNAAEDINFFWSCSNNYCWQPHEGRDGRLHGLGSKIEPKSPTKYHWKKANIKGF